MGLSTAKWTSQIIPLDIPWMGDKKNSAIPAPGQKFS
jgi:hypothetical protein